MRPLLLGLLLLPAPALAQVSGTRGKSCDGRIDLASVSGDATRARIVRNSGSYYLSSNLKVGTGQTGIWIDPAASSVEIDFNGYVVEGAPGQTSLIGVDCPASPSLRTDLTLHGPRIVGFGGAAVSAYQLGRLAVEDGVAVDCGGNGLDIQSVESVVVTQSTFHRCQTGIEVSNAGSVVIHSVDLSGCDRGMQLCARAIDVDGCSIRSCTTEGLRIEDACASPGTTPLTVANVSRTSILDSGTNGLVIATTDKVQFHGSELMSCRSVASNVLVPTVVRFGKGRVGFEKSVFNAGGSHGIEASVSGTGAPLDLVLRDVTSSQNLGDGVSILGAIRLDVEGTSSISNGGSGVHMTFAPGAPATATGDTRLVGLQCIDNGVDGLAMDASSLAYFGKLSLTDFHLDGNHRDGWNLRNVTAQAEHGTFKSNLRDGLHAEDSDVDLSSLGVADNGNDGLYVLRTRHKGWDGMIYGNHRNGITATDSVVQMRNVQIYRNTEDGVELSNSHYEQQLGNLDQCGLNGLSAVGGQVVLDGTTVSRNGQDGLQLASSKLWCFRVRVTDNGADGIDAFAPATDPATPVSLTDSSIEGNTGYGLITHGKSTPKLWETPVRGNAAGGLAVLPAGPCSPVLVELRGAAFDDNGGVACDLQNVKGGVVERCTFASSTVGLHVGDLSGGGCATGLRITDCTATQCATGFAVDAGGGHLVMRNFAALSSVAAFAVGPGNLFGPVIATQTDMDLATNPNANFAQ